MAAESIERALADLAGAQHGVVSRRQLAEIGMGERAMVRMVRRGRLQRLHRGVYAVGHRALRPQAHWMAAVLSAGPGTLLSHRSGTAAWHLRPHGGTRVEVTVRSAHVRGGPHVLVHRRACLPEQDVDERDGIPCTALPLTLMDLATVVPRREVERACDQAEVLRLFDLHAVMELLDRRSGERGAGVLRSIMEEHAIGMTLTRSRMEDRFLGLCRKAGLPRPAVNVPAVGLSGVSYEVDFLWRPARVILETDGRASHGTRGAFERDRRRDADLVAAGYRVLRCTWRQLTREPEFVLRTLTTVLDSVSGGLRTAGGT